MWVSLYCCKKQGTESRMSCCVWKWENRFRLKRNGSLQLILPPSANCTKEQCFAADICSGVAGERNLVWTPVTGCKFCEDSCHPGQTTVSFTSCCTDVASRAELAAHWRKTNSAGKANDAFLWGSSLLIFVFAIGLVCFFVGFFFFFKWEPIFEVFHCNLKFWWSQWRKILMKETKKPFDQLHLRGFAFFFFTDLLIQLLIFFF